MPSQRIPGIEPMSIANMVQNRVSAVGAWCEGPGCPHRVSIPLEQVYAMGFTDQDAVIDIGGSSGARNAATRARLRNRIGRRGRTYRAHHSSPTR